MNSRFIRYNVKRKYFKTSIACARPMFTQSIERVFADPVEITPASPVVALGPPVGSHRFAVD